MSQTILAIDASSNSCSVAISAGAKVIGRLSHEPRAHAQRLLPMIDDLMAEAQLSLEHIDSIGLVNGPGSFTGVRIALSIAQGLAYGAGIPVFCRSSLAVMCMVQTQLLSSKNLIVPALDARMGEIYWAVFEYDAQSGLPAAVVEPSVSKSKFMLETVSDLLQKRPQETQLIGLGSGYGTEDFCSEPLRQFNSLDSAIEPSASALISLMQSMQPDEPDFVSAEHIEPLYLRNEVAWKKRVRIREQKATNRK